MSSGSSSASNKTAKGNIGVDDVDTGSEMSNVNETPINTARILKEIDMFYDWICETYAAKRCPNIVKSLQGRTQCITHKSGDILPNLREAMRIIWKEGIADISSTDGVLTVECYLGNLFFPAALVDVNLTITILTLDAYNCLSTRGMMKSKREWITLANGKRVKKYGVVSDFMLFVGKVAARVTIHILDIKNVTHSLVLGRDFFDYSKAIIDLGRGRLIFPGKDEVELGYFKGCDAPFEDKDYLVFPMGNEFVMRVDTEKPYYLQPYETEDGYEDEYTSNEEMDYGDRCGENSDNTSDESYEDEYDEEGWFVRRVPRVKSMEEEDDDVIEVVNISDDEDEVIIISSDDESDDAGK